ncbi:hypothetical protein FZC84_21340 [Rossellomorea vietnamensis]|uniref:Uncharacterized protein n=1 Tax=Rossellomorea vietnamensis TaxID=218284 RepID=A0A5D4M1N8_9BACI|nr:hypothetical protein [Rossellomorea vietnamensis]TYR95739.1 hypothetical protein FZC84_21340 [Rossellomorea vietnamensis]
MIKKEFEVSVLMGEMSAKVEVIYINPEGEFYFEDFKTRSFIDEKKDVSSDDLMEFMSLRKMLLLEADKKARELWELHKERVEKALRSAKASAEAEGIVLTMETERELRKKHLGEI